MKKLLLLAAIILAASCERSYINEVPLEPKQNDYLTKIYHLETWEPSVAGSRPFYNPYEEAHNGRSEPGFIIAAPQALIFAHPDKGSFLATGYNGYLDNAWEYNEISGDWHDLTRNWSRMASIGYSGTTQTFGFMYNDYFNFLAPPNSYYNNVQLSGEMGIFNTSFDNQFTPITSSLTPCWPVGVSLSPGSTAQTNNHYWLFEAEGRLYQGFYDSQDATSGYHPISATATYGDTNLPIKDVLEAAGFDGGDGFFNQGGLWKINNYVYNPEGKFSAAQLGIEAPLTGEARDYLMVFDGNRVTRLIPGSEEAFPVGNAGNYIIVRGDDGNRGMARYHFLDAQGLDRGTIVVYGSHVHFAGEAIYDGEEGLYFSAANLYRNQNFFTEEEDPYRINFYFISLKTLKEQLR